MKRQNFFYEKNKIAKLLFEQEEDLFATDEEEEETEEPAEDEPAAEDAAEEPEADEATEEPEEEEVPDEARMKLGKVIDDDLEALLVDFETQARQSKKIEKDTQIDESLTLASVLFESAYEDEIDLERFTSEVARLIKNYDTLLDMEDLILSKAKSFIIARYGEDAATEMENSLADNHDVEVVAPKGELKGEDEVPVAVGAGKAGE